MFVCVCVCLHKVGGMSETHSPASRTRTPKPGTGEPPKPRTHPPRSLADLEPAALSSSPPSPALPTRLPGLGLPALRVLGKRRAGEGRRASWEEQPRGKASPARRPKPGSGTDGPGGGVVSSTPGAPEPPPGHHLQPPAHLLSRRLAYALVSCRERPRPDPSDLGTCLRRLGHLTRARPLPGLPV